MEPWFIFDTPAIVIAAYRGNREMVDILLEYGANINVKSSWWGTEASLFHILIKDGKFARITPATEKLEDGIAQKDANGLLALPSFVAPKTQRH